MKKLLMLAVVVAFVFGSAMGCGDKPKTTPAKTTPEKTTDK